VVMWNLILITLLSAGVEFDVQTLDGRTDNGQLVELNAEQVVLEGAAGRNTFPLAGLAAMARAGDAGTPRKPILWLELVDQSLLPASEFTSTGGTAHVRLTTGAELDVPTRAIRWVRFSAGNDREPKLARQWSDIIDAKVAGDLLVVRKSGALDYLEGVQGDVDAEICKFELDKEIIPVKRTKVEGIVYAHPAGADLPEAAGEISSIDGARLAMRTASLGEGAVNVTTPSGIKIKLPLEEIARFDFSTGKIAFLSDLQPDSAVYLPYFSLKPDLPVLSEFYQYRRDVGFEQNPLRLDGKTYRKGLSLQSRTTLSYKLPGKFRLLKSVAGIDDSVRETGSVRLEIKGDGKTLWSGDVRGSEPPRELEVEIAGVKRLEVIADYGEDLDIGDRLDLADIRVTK
jgi:hypothetical protein